MAHLTIAERARIAIVTADRSRRRKWARLMSSPFLRWRYGAPVADQLLIVPPDLRTADPSFYREIELGQFGLAGTVAVLGSKSPFELRPPNEAWARSLHGFGWLRHLRAAESDDAQSVARDLALEWTIRHGAGRGVADHPDVAGRRIISWLSNAGMLLEGADPQTYERLAQSLGADLVRLSASWGDGPDGYPRLVALIALVLSGLCVSGHDRHLDETEHILAVELGRQILDDGGHISRNAGILVELMLDLLPLKQCFASRSRLVPASITDTMDRVMSMLRTMRMGDGMLARFNGMSIAVPAGLATVLAYDDRPDPTSGTAKDSGYVRVERDRTIVIMDVGGPPPLEHAGRAHAGCLSFELSTGNELLFINGGAPGPADANWRATARATASHNTLCLAEASSSRLIRHQGLEDLIGGAPIRGPASTSVELEEHGGNIELITSHNGYVGRYGLVHQRSLALNASGRRLLGIDKLAGQRSETRLRYDLPFAIHFHLHPDVVCQKSETSGIATLTLKSGETWTFSVEGAELTIEDSTYFADSAGPRRAMQLVARSATFGATEVRWVLECSAKRS